MKNRSHDGLAAKGLFSKKPKNLYNIKHKVKYIFINEDSRLVKLYNHVDSRLTDHLKKAMHLHHVPRQEKKIQIHLPSGRVNVSFY